jgi:hypothetical protein
LNSVRVLEDKCRQFLTFREEHKLQASENKVFRTIPFIKKDEANEQIWITDHLSF